MRRTTRTSSTHHPRTTIAATADVAGPRSFSRRLRTVLAAALALAALTAGPAAAQINDFGPGGSGPDDEEEEPPILIPIPLDEPSISLDLTPTCGDTPGVQYVIEVANPYPGQHLYELHWAVSQPLLFPNTIHSQAGFVPTGEGEFAFRADAENLGQLGWNGSTDWTDITVDCEDDGDDEEEEDDPEEEEEVDPDDEDIVTGNPNFTG